MLFARCTSVTVKSTIYSDQAVISFFTFISELIIKIVCLSLAVRIESGLNTFILSVSFTWKIPFHVFPPNLPHVPHRNDLTTSRAASISILSCSLHRKLPLPIAQRWLVLKARAFVFSQGGSFFSIASAALTLPSVTSQLFSKPGVKLLDFFQIQSPVDVFLVANYNIFFVAPRRHRRRYVVHRWNCWIALFNWAASSRRNNCQTAKK